MSLKRRALKKLQLVIFYRQLATLQSAGIPLLQTLQIIGKNKTSKALMLLTKELQVKLASGYSFSKALNSYCEFDALQINLIAMGENIGQLHIILTLLANHLEKHVKFQSKFYNAILYPSIVIMVAIIAIAILLIKVVPTFTEVFTSLDVELTYSMQLILKLSISLEQHWIKFIIIFLVTIFCLKKISKQIAFKIPIIRILLHRMLIVNFCNILALSSAAGMPLQQAIILITKTHLHKEFVNAMQIILQSIAAGKSLHDALRLSKFFPPLLLQMIAIAEETATLDNVLQKVASIYEEELDLILKRFITLLDPVLMLIVGIIVGGLVLTIYTPIFNLGTVI